MYDDPLMAHYDMKILMDFSTQLSHFQQYLHISMKSHSTRHQHKSIQHNDGGTCV